MQMVMINRPLEHGTAFLLQGNPQVQLVPVGTKIMVFPYKGMLDILG